MEIGAGMRRARDGSALRIDDLNAGFLISLLLSLSFSNRGRYCNVIRVIQNGALRLMIP